MLRAVRTHLGMDVAFVSEFRETERVFHNVDARGHSPIHPGDAAPLDSGYCKKVVDGVLPELIPDTRGVPAAVALPETQAIPIGAHLSVPILLDDGAIYGTFCCFSFDADPSLGTRDLQMMKAFADLLGHQLSRDQALIGSRTDKLRRITSALDCGQPGIVYQPIYDITKHRAAGMECLARFSTDTPRSPDKWFAEAAEIGLGIDLEVSAICTALEGLDRMAPGTYLSVNASPEMVISGALAQILRSVDCDQVVLEITEHQAIPDYQRLGSALEHLRDRGLRLAIDDAGAGYASMRHILMLQPDIIKLDLSLTHGIDADPRRRAMASALIAFAGSTGSTVIAEGVENQSELGTLQRLGVSRVQGYFVSRPMPLEDAAAWSAEHA
ncbi:MAG: EAL domain-containing protein [Burkholderiales bacterium]|nr:EAL domain-containing protein [Burkholderiales bacterium]